MNHLANFLYEVGTLRKIDRVHHQVLLTSDPTDNIASHSFRVAIIGMFLAFIENADAGTVVIMGLSHDWPETRSNDHNRVHKGYIRIDTKGIIRDQSAMHSFEVLKKIIEEYEKRESKESIIAKDSDSLEQIMLLKEYALQGNEEAKLWLEGVNKRPYARVDELALESSKELGRQIYDTSPSEWWKNIFTSVNLPFEQK